MTPSYRCDSCGFTDEQAAFPPAEHITMRMTPGDIYTDRECPECAALAFPVAEPRDRQSVPELQSEIDEWVTSVCGTDARNSLHERVTRVIEEALELAQAEGLSKDAAARLVEFVFSRPAGEPEQEASGLGMTLLSYCAVKDFDLIKIVRAELSRVSTPAVRLSVLRNHVRKVAAGVGRNWSSDSG